MHNIKSVLFKQVKRIRYRKYPYVSIKANMPSDAIVYNNNNIVLEDNTSLGNNAVIMNTRAKFIMKQYSFSARDLLVVTGNHMPVLGIPLIKVSDKMKDELDKSKKFDKDVIVDEDVWLGARVTLLSGSHIGRGAIIAAGAVVNGGVTPYSIWGGVPSKFIKYRWTIDEIIEHEKKIYPEDKRFSVEDLQALFCFEKK